MNETPQGSVATVDELCTCLDITPEQLNALLGNLYSQYRKAKVEISGKQRTFYIATPSLKRIQDRIQQWLSQLPLHDAVHGWRIGHSTVTCAQGHTGKAIVMHVDIKDFFPSIGPGLVFNVLVHNGFTPEVASVLTKLTTHRNHLAQGLDTSPVIANLVLWQVDIRMATLALKTGCGYRRYGDDLIFSGSFDWQKVFRTAGAILKEAGFRINAEKFRKRGVRNQKQRQELLGLTVNQKVNITKEKRERYRSLVAQCINEGPESVLEEGETLLHLKHRLMGYINYYKSVNPQAAASLEQKYKTIDWPTNPSEKYLV
jgi:RNA-directed DNA polymerase